VGLTLVSTLEGILLRDKPYLDAKCWILLNHIVKAEEDWLWLRRLFEICSSGEAKRNATSMSEKTVRIHFGHLEESGLIEYERRTSKKGSKKRFRLRLDSRWKEPMRVAWCQKVHDLARQATSLGQDSVDEQLAFHDLAEPKRPIRGKLLLQYASKPFVDKDQTARSMVAQDMLLDIRWEYVKRKCSKFDIRISPNATMPEGN